MLRRRLLSILFVVTVLFSCSRRSGDPGTSSGASPGDACTDDGSFHRGCLLRAFGECALGTAREFQTAATAFDAAARAAEATGTPEAREAARAAWKNAIDVWERAEIMQFGPAAMTGAPGGQDLRDGIYAWPLVGRCLIESQIVAQSYDKPDFATTLVSTRGLAGAEYVLFYEGNDNVCPPTNTINAGGSWTALGDAELAKRKLAYARAIAVDVAQRAGKLVDAWDPAKGNFVSEIASAPNKTFPTQQLALNSVSDAVFYVDDATKTMKVAKPAGLTPDCAAPPCLDLVESPYAKRSKEHLKNNLAGYEALMRGCGPGASGLGFDDLLVSVGAEATAKKLEASLASTRNALAALTGASFDDDLKTNPAGVKALFEALKDLNNILKTEFATILDLELPKRVEGDND